MHRIDGPGATEDGRFTDGNPAAGIPPTIVTDDWANAMQEEIVGVIAGAGMALDKADNGQLLEAITKLGPERFKGFATSGQHEAWEADPAAINRNSLYAVRKGTASGLPDDMPAEAWAFVHTMVMPGDIARTQLLWSVDAPDHPGWWRRRAAGAWGEWKGVGSGGSGMPIGMTFWWPGTTPPAGSLAINDGPLLSRAAYPQLWAMAQASGNIITETAWQAQAAVQSSVGAFSSGDGATTFRCPRLRDFVRGADPAGGVPVGSWRADAMQGHGHQWERSSDVGKYAGMTLTTAGGGVGVLISGFSNTASGTYSWIGDPVEEGYGPVRVASETRGKAVHWLPCIKAFDTVTNAGEVDIAALAATLAGKVDRSDWVTLVPGAAWRRPDGIIEQRMKVQESPNVSTRRLWPVAFPSECYGAWITPADLGTSSQVTAQADVTGVIFREGAAYGDSSSYFYVFGIGR